MRRSLNRGPSLFRRAAGRVWRPIRRLKSQLSVFSDLESWRTHGDLLRKSPALERGRLYPIRVRELRHREVYCRPDTTDVNVFDDTFFGRYHLPPRDLGSVRTLVDLGSNIGLTMVHYAVLFPRAEILGIEMDEANYGVCQVNLAGLGPRCRVIHGAVWPSAGRVLYEGTMSSAFRISRMSDDGVRAHTVQELLDAIRVPVVDFLKMDVEGAEGPLLEGAEAWISRVRCLKVEVHEPFTVEMCANQLGRLGVRWVRDLRHPACLVAFNDRMTSS